MNCVILRIRGLILRVPIVTVGNDDFSATIRTMVQDVFALQKKKMIADIESMERAQKIQTLTAMISKLIEQGDIKSAEIKNAEKTETIKGMVRAFESSISDEYKSKAMQTAIAIMANAEPSKALSEIAASIASPDIAMEIINAAVGLNENAAPFIDTPLESGQVMTLKPQG